MVRVCDSYLFIYLRTYFIQLKGSLTVKSLIQSESLEEH